MPNVLIGLAYDGTNYSGFQVQKNALTIQEQVESALAQLYTQQIKLHGAGRTDAGVHARGQTATFYAPDTVPADRIPWALNSFLPGDIIVWSAQEVPPTFHARISAVRKKYTYSIDLARFRQVMWRFYAWHCKEPLDLELIAKGARLFEGTHDFAAFQAKGSPVQTTVRTIYKLESRYSPDEQILRISVTGNGFLYKMVRFMVGSLIELGAQKIAPADIQAALAGHCKCPGPALPPLGLCLERVWYDTPEIDVQLQ